MLLPTDYEILVSRCAHFGQVRENSWSMLVKSNDILRGKHSSLVEISATPYCYLQAFC